MSLVAIYPPADRAFGIWPDIPKGGKGRGTGQLSTGSHCQPEHHSAPQPPPKTSDATQQLRGPNASEKAQVAMINIGGEQTQSAATGAVPTSQGTTVAPSVSSLSKSVFTVDGVTT